MKKIIDNETGEVIEVEESNDLVERKLFEVGAIDEATFDFLEQYLTIQEQYEIFRYKLEEAFKKNNIKKWENNYFIVNFQEESTQKRVDTDRLKEDGIYDKYLKLVPVKERITIKFKKEK